MAAFGPPKIFNSKFLKNCLTLTITCYILYKRFAERAHKKALKYRKKARILKIE